jgi:hypothetical protein
MNMRLTHLLSNKVCLFLYYNRNWNADSHNNKTKCCTISGTCIPKALCILLNKLVYLIRHWKCEIIIYFLKISIKVPQNSHLFNFDLKWSHNWYTYLLNCLGNKVFSEVNFWKKKKNWSKQGAIFIWTAIVMIFLLKFHFFSKVKSIYINWLLTEKLFAFMTCILHVWEC